MFRNAKVGDRVWDLRFGWGAVTNIEETAIYPITVLFGNNRGDRSYTTDGKISIDDINPTLFWGETKLEITVKPFDLKEFLKENLEPKNFKIGDCNLFLAFNTGWYIGKSKRNNVIGTVYFKIKTDDVYILETLNEEQITPEQLKQAYKELGWL